MARTSLIWRMFVIVYFLSFAKIGPFFQSPIQRYSWVDLNHDKLRVYSTTVPIGRTLRHCLTIKLCQ